MSLAEKETDFLPILCNEVKAQLDIYDNQVDNMVSMVKSIRVVDSIGAEKALELAGSARKLKKRIEETKLSITSPHRDFVSEINCLAKKYVERLDKISLEVEQKLNDWRYVTESSALARDIASNYGDLSDPNSSFLQDTRKVEARSCTATTKDIWKYEVSDIFDVPIDYLEVSDNSVKLAIKNGVRAIPGIRIYKETVTQLRSK